MSRTLCGACYCGGVEIAVQTPSRFVCHCHCHNCRRAHGAAFVTWAGFPMDRFRIVKGEEQLGRYLTDTGATRSFCRTCGTPMLYQSDRWPGEVHVAVASLRDPIDQSPALHAYADRAPDWCPISDELPRFGGPSGTDPL